MSGNRNSYGTISRGDSSRRRRRRRDNTIRVILALVLVCVLVLAVGFLGVNALKNSSKVNNGNETKSSEDIPKQTNAGETTGPNGETNGPDGETNGSSGETNGPSGETNGPSGETNGSNGETTEPPVGPGGEYVPETVSKEHTVWLDAGHGGYDYGTSEWKRDEQGNVIDKDGKVVDDSDKNDLTNRGIAIVREKEDTLLLTLAIQEALEERGVTVLMTRTDDSATTVQDRAALANETDAECFISIHRNYMIGDTKTCGIEALLVNEGTRSEIPGKEKDADLLQFIFDELAKEKTNGINGSKREPVGVDDYAVLWRTKMPSIILEMGYLSNASDNELFRSNIDEYARAIADGIVQWLRTQE